jgi:carbamoyltransferase
LNIVGISALFHDSAASILQDGILAAAAQEERFTRHKHDSSFPKYAFRYCLEQAGLSISDIDCVAYYENPQRKLERQIWMMHPNLSEELCVRIWQKAKKPEIEIREMLG